MQFNVIKSNLETYKAGTFISIEYRTTCKISAKAKKDGVVVEKIVRGTVRLGIDYINLASQKERVFTDERVPLPWGVWYLFPYLIKHKENYYLRCYLTKGQHLESTYYLNGQEVDKEEIEQYLLKSSSSVTECFSVNINNILRLGKALA